MIQPGTRIGPYTVEAEIGMGATAVVYRVRHSGLETLRALKVLSVSHPQLRDRMLREGRMQAKLKHPNIVRVLDTLDVDGSLGLLMEHVDGMNLDEWLRQRPAPVGPVLESVAEQIVAAVAYAHGEGLVHRDLKPANVLVEEGDEGASARVTDFGLAKVLDAGPRGLHDTRTGLALGTPRYMAPEQMRSAKHVDARADVFSLGCLLYEVFCGRPAFPQLDMLDVFNAVSDGVYDDPLLIADVPNPVLEAIRAALQQDPDDRPPDARALLDILEAPHIADLETAAIPIHRRGSPAPHMPHAPLQPVLPEPLMLPVSEVSEVSEVSTVLDDAHEGPGMPWLAMVLASISAMLGTMLVVSVVLALWMSLFWRVP